jgi:aryl-alcohol dehydrogenase-like predicted oxidoreductase
MRTRPIPRTGEPLPVLGLGTWKTFDVDPEGPDAAALLEVLRRFHAAGGRLVDSSPMYGRAEEVVGALRARLPPEARGLFLATKVWTEGAEAGRAQMERSFARMGAGPRMDLLQVHNLLDWRAHLPTLRAWKAEGRVRYLGVTHYQLSAFDELERLVRTEALDFLQLPYSLEVREAEARLLPAAADTGTAVLVMKPFGGGRLLQRLAGRPLPEWVREELGCRSWAQALLKFLLGHPAVTCPLPATRSPAHLEDNLAAAEGPLPDAAQRARLVRDAGL